MKIDRLMGIAMLLLQREKVTAPELARRFEVSRRTINRDIEDLCKAGIPIATTQGRNGGISILEGYKVEAAVLSEEERQAVISGLKGIDSVSGTPYLAGVMEKLSRKNSALQADDAVIIDLASHYRRPLTQKLEALKWAIHARRQVTFRYYYEKGEGVRHIEPYHLIFKWSDWYVLGYCLARQDYRLFKLNRLWELEVDGQGYTPRAVPEEVLRLENYFSSQAFHLKALFAKEEKYRLIEEYGVDCYRETEGGELLLERDFTSYRELCRWVFGFGDRVRVLEPERLLEDQRRQAENILARRTPKA